VVQKSEGDREVVGSRGVCRGDKEQGAADRKKGNRRQKF